MQDMKEVRRIVTSLLEDSVKEVYVITIRTYRHKISFFSSFVYGGFTKYSAELLNNNDEIKEISEMQVKLTQKKNNIVRKLIKATTGEIDNNLDIVHTREIHEVHNVTSLRDDYGIISSIYSNVQSALNDRLIKITNIIVESYNKYLNTIESRTFDAYTKGMSADDFLLIVRDEIKVLQLQVNDLKKELEEHEYSTTD
jgi:hypothetical protein